jgi:hypothetical protein
MMLDEVVAYALEEEASRLDLAVPRPLPRPLARE